MTLTVLLTLVLAGATVWLAWSTQRMASATKDLIALSAQPYLSFTSLTLLIIENLPGYSIRLHLSQVRIIYEVQAFVIGVRDVQYAPTVAPDNRGAPIHPNESSEFDCQPFKCEVPPAIGLWGTLELRIAFWASPEDRKQLALKLRWVLARENDQRVTRFTYLSGPTYN